MTSRGERSKKIDYILLSMYFALVALGALMIYATTISDDPITSYSAFLKTAAGNQIIWVGISLFALAVIQLVDWKFWQISAFPIYLVSIILLVLVLFFGVEVRGNTSWFRIGSFGFQPSEIAKFATSLALASYLGAYNTDIKRSSNLVIILGLIFLPAGLILLQPDAGSALIFVSFFILLYREGFSFTYIGVGLVAAIILVITLAVDDVNIVTLGLIGITTTILTTLFKTRFYWIVSAIIVLFFSFYFWGENSWKFILLSNSIILSILATVHYVNKKARIITFTVMALLLSIGIIYSADYAFDNFLKPYQQERIYMWLRPEKCDPKGPLYNVIQSKLAISSGGVTGKGLFQGTLTKLNYVPQQLTDFIFCTIGEEHGFIGSLGLIGVFLALLLRILFIAERQRSNFSRIYAYGIAGIIFFHVFINVGMTMGLVPTIGVPLPFISKGGSSLFTFTVMVAVLLKLDSRRYSI